jgi:hypothetical protein
VDIGAPGVAIPSLLPKVYSDQASDLYSPSSGTSMAAPYVSNLAAQIKNTNPSLTPAMIKKVILETGDVKDHLKGRLTAGAIVDNNKALKAALLSKDMSLDQAISLGVSGLIPMEDKITIGGLPPAVTPEEVKKKMLESFPSVITPQEVDEDPTIEALPTKSSSSLPKNPVKVPQDNSSLPVSVPQDEQPKSSDPVPSSPSEEQSQQPSAEPVASSSQSQSPLPEVQSPETSPSLPQ